MADEWHLNNPSKGMTIYDLPALVAIAYTNAATPSNIQAGFKSTGIYSFNSQIFSDLDFLPGYVTDHDILLPAAGEAGTTSNKTPENLLKDQLFGNNEIANSTAANIEQQPSTSVVLKLFAPAAHFATFPNFAAHLDQSADLFWCALSFPRFALPDALYCIT